MTREEEEGEVEAMFEAGGAVVEGEEADEVVEDVEDAL